MYTWNGEEEKFPTNYYENHSNKNMKIENIQFNSSDRQCCVHVRCLQIKILNEMQQQTQQRQQQQKCTLF